MPLRGVWLDAFARSKALMNRVSLRVDPVLIDPIPMGASEDAPIAHERSRSVALRLALSAQRCTQCAVAATGLAEIIDFKVG